MPILNLDLRYIRWVLGHIDEATAIVESIQLALAAPQHRDKVLGFHPVLDSIAAIIEDFPAGFGDATVFTEPELATQVKAEAEAKAINWTRLLEIAKTLLPFILMFLEPGDMD
jgi:hypothetical protein